MHSKELELEFAGSQIDGARKYQEDAFLITHLTGNEGNSSALVIVADGMGGHAAGNVASNMVVHAYNKYVSAHYPSKNISTVLRHAVLRANKTIKETIAETPALKSMGCTIVAALLEQNKLWWASVGDSHLYLFRGGRRLKKNIDHSYGGFLDRTLAANMPVEPDPNLSRNMLMSAINGEDIHEMDVPEEPFILQQGDRILLCSDGLDTLSEAQSIECCQQSRSAKIYADSLMDMVIEANVPRQDNTTVIVIDVKGKKKAAVPSKQQGQPAINTRPAHSPPSRLGSNQYRTHGSGGLKKIIGITAAIAIVTVATVYVVLDRKKNAELVAGFVVGDTNTELAGAVDAGQDPIEAVADTTEPASTQAAVADTATVKKPKQQTIAIKTIQDRLKSGGKAPLMVIIPAGEFLMGGSSISRYAEELPRHKITVASFAVSQHEISIAEYNRFARGEKQPLYQENGVNEAVYPVALVTWNAAYNYTKWLSAETGKKYRLPSEAEWEYMASTGEKSPFWWGYDEELDRARCFNCEASLNPGKPAKIGSFKPNAFGVYDTAGNVGEWVHDCWHSNYQGAPATAEVWQGGDCAYRVVRGGNYNSPYNSVRSAKRDKYDPNRRYDNIGIRVVREIK